MAVYKTYYIPTNSRGKFTAHVPILKDALSWFECNVVHEYDDGDHVVYIGEVIDAGVHRSGDPLTLHETGLFYGD